MNYKIIANINRWYLFLLMTSIVVFGSSIAKSLNDTPYEKISKIVLLLLVLVYNYGWLFAVGEYLHSKVAVFSNLSLDRFKKSVVVILLYFFSAIMYIQFQWDELGKLLFLEAIITMIANIYMIYFVAKSIAILEQGRNYDFNNIVKLFVLICFLPFGILSLQPRISKMNK